MIVAVIAAGSYFLLDVSVVEALLLGTILASTDPVVSGTWSGRCVCYPTEEIAREPVG